MSIDTHARTLTISTKLSVKSPSVCLPNNAPNTLLRLYWRNKLNDHQKSEMTPEAIEVRIWGFVVVMVTLVLVFIVGMLLYSVTFVTQPIKSMAPIDQAYTKMLNDIVLLIVGGIGGIMTKRVTKAASNAFTPTNPPCVGQSQYPQAQYPYVPAAAPFVGSFQGQPIAQPGAMPTWVNPALDETWTPGPPPTTPDDYLHPEREEIAQERANARIES
jgi:hypothetical protein